MGYNNNYLSTVITILSTAINIFAALLSFAVWANRKIQRFSGWIQITQKTLLRFHLCALGCPSKAFVICCVPTKHILYSNCIEAFNNRQNFILSSLLEIELKCIKLCVLKQYELHINILFSWRLIFFPSVALFVGLWNVRKADIQSKALFQTSTRCRHLDRLSHDLTIKPHWYKKI